MTRKNRAREPLTATAGKIDPQLTVQLVCQRPSAISLAAHAWQSREAPSGARCSWWGGIILNRSKQSPHRQRLRP